MSGPLRVGSDRVRRAVRSGRTHSQLESALVRVNSAARRISYAPRMVGCARQSDALIALHDPLIARYDRLVEKAGVANATLDSLRARPRPIDIGPAVMISRPCCSHFTRSSPLYIRRISCAKSQEGISREMLRQTSVTPKYASAYNGCHATRNDASGPPIVVTSLLNPRQYSATYCG